MDQTYEVAAVVEAARQGDQEAWNALVERYLPLVTAVIAKHRLMGADAEDVNQTVWLRLVEHLADIREPRAMPGWIATTTRHECLRVIRLRQRSVPTDPLGPSPLELTADVRQVDEDLLSEERRQALREAILELPPDRQQLLILLLTDPPISYQEIGERLGIPMGSIGPTRARALDKLRNTTALSALVTASLADESGR